MISPLNAKLDRKWIEASQRIATLEQQVAELVAALKDWDGLIKHNYSGSREAMSAMQQCAFDTADLLSKVKQNDHSHRPD